MKHESSYSTAKLKSELIGVIIGMPDFCRRMQAFMRSRDLFAGLHSGNYVDAWSLVLTHRPNILIFEVGLEHNSDLHDQLKASLAQVRERLKKEVYIIMASTSSTTTSYCGDLLFKNATETTGSGIVDAMICIPPENIYETPDINEQMSGILKVIEAARHDPTSAKTLPSLNEEDWIQSQADPLSRDLWLRWIPRYSNYVNESPLIIGETGTGKTKVAYALHQLSGRPGKFVSITPRDFSSSELVQAELFGAVAGAYTGAVDKWGLVKSAEKGTLFIDELQSIDKELQGKLITFIENKTYRRVGSAESIEADVRFVFASNKSLEEMIKQDILREDFAYRLERVQLKLLPLRARRLDICAALAFALGKIHRQRPNSRSITGFSGAAYRLLYCHRWPGNLRQLENTVAQLCDLAELDGSKLITEAHVYTLLGTLNSDVQDNFAEIISNAASLVSKNAFAEKFHSLHESIAEFEANARIAALQAAKGDAIKAAQILQDDDRLVTLAAEKSRDEKTLGRL